MSDKKALTEKKSEDIPQQLQDLKPNPYILLNGTVHFNGNCNECRPYCGAICCASYHTIKLTETEAKSGKFLYKKASPNCNCDLCNIMREQGIKHTLLRQPDGSCIYLDGTRKCSIYEDRPEACRNYTCKQIPFMVVMPQYRKRK